MERSALVGYSHQPLPFVSVPYSARRRQSGNPSLSAVFAETCGAFAQDSDQFLDLAIP